MYECTKCGETKPSEEYSMILNRKKDRVRNRQCKSCVSEYKRQHYRKNRDKYLEEARNQRKRLGAEKISEYNRQYRERNKDRIAERVKEYTQRPHVRERINERFRGYRKDPDFLKKERARGILNKRIQSGKVVKPDKCIECGELGYVEAHHEDYDKPLDVVWLCKQCHENRHHSNEGQGA